MARILVADDEVVLRDLIRRALVAAGHQVTTADDGAEALERLESEAGGFDLLLTDIKMPVMDGIALALAAKPLYPALTIVLMTGYADQRERGLGLETLIHSVLTKPFTVAELQARVAAALDSAKS